MWANWGGWKKHPRSHTPVHWPGAVPLILEYRDCSLVVSLCNSPLCNPSPAALLLRLIAATVLPLNAPGTLWGNVCHISSWGSVALLAQGCAYRVWLIPYFYFSLYSSCSLSPSLSSPYLVFHSFPNSFFTSSWIYICKMALFGTWLLFLLLLLYNLHTC